MSRYDELVEKFSAKYGPNWDRTSDLTVEEEIEWVEACYDHYASEKTLKGVYGGPYSDQYEAWFGHPFEIVEPIAPGTEGYDLISLPMWLIRITDMEGAPDDPGIFAAYPEELFVDA